MGSDNREGLSGNIPISLAFEQLARVLPQSYAMAKNGLRFDNHYC